MRAVEERFLSRPMVIALALYGLFAATFAHFQVKGDGLVYFNLLRRFFGEHPDSAFAYQFGSDLWNAPFFLVGKAFGMVFGYQPFTFHVAFEEIAMTVAANAAFVATLYLVWRILGELDLPRHPSVLFLATFGSPLFYYVVFEPSSKHAVDTLYIAFALFLLLRLLRDEAGRRAAILLGATVGVSLNTRYVNVAFFLPIAFVLLRHRRSDAAWGIAAAVVAGGILFALPALRGISYFVPSYFPKSQALAAAVHPTVGAGSNPLNGFDPLIPLKMLFSRHRGLYLWTPLTALATVGFALVLRRPYGDARHTFLWTLASSAAALVLVHAIWGQWDGGYAFSQRFLTSLFPVFAVGVAELRRRLDFRIYPALVVCVAWSVALAFVHDIGYDGVSQRDGVDRVANVLQTNFARKRHQVDGRATARWGYLWALLHGRDPEHIHGPPPSLRRPLRK